jgi:hypothetical protein
MADSLEAAGEQPFTFTHWKSARTTNASERFARRVQAADQDAGGAALGGDRCYAILVLLASGQIRLRKVDGWRTLDRELAQPIDLAA